MKRKDFWIFGLFVLLGGCAATGPQPKVDLNTPGWVVKTGQAVWRPKAEKPEIAGEFLLATHPDGHYFVQFSKTLPLVNARVSPNSWEVEFPPENKKYRGGGKGPKRLMWVQLLRGLEGREVQEPWQVFQPSPLFLGVNNQKTGESLEVHLDR